MGGFANNAPIVTDGLVFYVDAGNGNSYPGSGGTWSDLIGGNDGSFNNMDDVNNPSDNYDSANGGSIQLDGTNEKITIGNLSSNLYSMSIWVKFPNSFTSTTAVKGLMTISGNSGTVQGGIGLGGNLTGTATDETLTILTGTGSIFPRTYIRDVIPSGWNYITMNWNGSSYDIYLNAVKKTAYAATSPHGHVPLMSASNVVLGTGWYDNIAQVLNGDISNVAIYNAALTETEITQNYNALKNRFV